MRRAAVASVAGMMTVLGLAGCVPVACPAIGWSNTLTVQLDGDDDPVAEVQLCTVDGCAPGEDVDLTGPLGLVTVTDQRGDAWTFSVGMTLPERFTVRTVGEDGTVLSDTEVAPEWVRVGGSAQCGGPHEATVAP